MGNAIFILITGYFMVSSSVHWKKIAVLLVTMLFYSWLIELIVYGGGLLPFSVRSVFQQTFPILFGSNWFVSCYIIFSFFIPFINRFLLNLEKNKYQCFLLLFFAFFEVFPDLEFNTFFSDAPIMFFFLIYSCGAYIKLYGEKILSPSYHKRYLLIFIILLMLLWGSILFFDAIGLIFHKDSMIKGAFHLFLILQIPMAMSLFLYFLTKPRFYNACINKIAGTILGIYLIHDNDLMRIIIWNDILPNLDYIHSSWYILFYAGKVAAVFVFCSVIEYLRKRYLSSLFLSCVNLCDAMFRKGRKYTDIFLRISNRI